MGSGRNSAFWRWGTSCRRVRSAFTKSSKGAVPEEYAMIRRIGGLIYVTDRDRTLARKGVLERSGRQL